MTSSSEVTDDTTFPSLSLLKPTMAAKNVKKRKNSNIFYGGLNRTFFFSCAETPTAVLYICPLDVLTPQCHFSSRVVLLSGCDHQLQTGNTSKYIYIYIFLQCEVYMGSGDE